MNPPSSESDPPSPLGEFGRIERFFRPLAAGFPGALDLADDAAMIGVPPGRELVVTTDAIVAGIHFLPADEPGDIARKALRVNLSDLAAKGARPMAYLLTLALRPEIDDCWVGRFADALARDQATFGISLAGGDSVSTEGPVWVSITAFGLVDAGRMVRRAGARPGDVVYVTGTIGDAALGLAVATGGLRGAPDAAAYVLSRYRVPQPRSALAATVAEHARAALDVSDGLAADFGHLCRASGVDGVIEVERVPVSPAARRLLDLDPANRWMILGGGDDYEILFTAPPDAAGALAAAARAVDIDITPIGRIVPGGGNAVFVDGAGAPMTIARPGWTHG